MGFPDSFKTECDTVEPNRFYHQIGNAVCPPVIKAIIEMVLPVLTADNEDRTIPTRPTLSAVDGRGQEAEGTPLE